MGNLDRSVSSNVAEVNLFGMSDASAIGIYGISVSYFGAVGSEGMAHFRRCRNVTGPEILVYQPAYTEGDSDCSLMRASSVVKRQFTGVPS